MNKRGLSGVIATVLIILITLVAVMLAWFFISNFLNSSQQSAKAKSFLLGQEVSITKFQGNTQNPGIIKLTLSRYSDQDISINYTSNTTETSNTILSRIDSNIILATDLSTSMSDCTYINSTGSYSSSIYNCCLSKNACLNYNTCTSAQPSGCGSTWEPKFSLSQEASRIFLKIVLNNTSNKVGIVGYNHNVSASNFHVLSNNFIELNNTINNLKLAEKTCICCGIINSTNELVNSYSTNLRRIVLLTDGIPNDHCYGGTGNVGDLNGDGTSNDLFDYGINDSITAACKAYKKYNITIDTIGFGNEADFNFLRNISACANGTAYTISNLNEIESKYSLIANNVISINMTSNITKGTITENRPSEDISYIKLVFYSSTGDAITRKITDVPKILERQTYSIDLTGNITNIKRIEAYPAVLTSKGEEILGAKFGIWGSN